ncbi:MAG: hypothetical protein R3F19_11260 [Verrucomicrobiales bacterium]
MELDKALTTTLVAALTLLATTVSAQEGAAGVTELIASPDGAVAYGLLPELGEIVEIELDGLTLARRAKVGTRPADIALDELGKALYVIDGADGKVFKLGLDSFAVEATRQPSPFSNRSGQAPRVTVGNNGLLVIRDGALAANLIAFEFETGKTHAPFTIERGDYFHGFQDVDYDATTGTFIAATGNAINKTNEFSFIYEPRLVRLRFADGGWNVLGTTEAPLDNHNIGSHALRSSADRSVYVLGKRVVSGATLEPLNVTNPLTRRLVGISADGKVTVALDSLLSAANGGHLIDLPEVGAATALPGNRLLIAPTDGSAFRMIAVAQVIDYFPSDGGTAPFDGLTVRFPNETTNAENDVYLGMDLTAVAAANPQSSEFLGRTSDAEFRVADPLVPGGTYYWRVDRLSDDGAVIPGPVLSFTARGWKNRVEYSPSSGDGIYGPLAIAGNYAACVVDYGEEPEGALLFERTSTRY